MTEANFDYLAKYDVGDNTVDYELYQLDGTPVLKLAPATADNKAYQNAMFRSRNAVRRATSKKLTQAQIDEGIERNKKLYAEHVIKGWSGVTDSSGNEVPFSKAACAAFLRSLPDWIFGDIVMYASEPENFIETIDTEEVAKN